MDQNPNTHRKASLNMSTYVWYRSQLLSMPGAGVEFDRTTYYKIPFWQAADLIGKRQARTLGCVCREMGRKSLCYESGQWCRDDLCDVSLLPPLFS